MQHILSEHRLGTEYLVGPRAQVVKKPARAPVYGLVYGLAGSAGMIQKKKKKKCKGAVVFVGMFFEGSNSASFPSFPTQTSLSPCM